MAQVFPLNVDDLSQDEARASLSGTLAALPDPWTLLRDRRIGDEEAEPVEVVLVHPEIGVALVDEGPRHPAAGARRLRQYLDEQRFGEFFPGELPIVSLSVARDDFHAVGEQLASAFEAAPRLSVADADWADAVIELLMVPDDLAMAPVADEAAASVPELAASAARGGAFEEAARGHFDNVTRERFDEGSRERLGEPPLELRAPLRDGDEPPLPLMVDWPFAASYQRKRRRRRVAALAVTLVLLAGASLAAWKYAGEDLTMAANDAAPRPLDGAAPSPNAPSPVQDGAPRSQIEVPLPRQSSDQSAVNPALTTPPPVPSAAPVVLAQKPYAPPPPKPPKPTPVKPLPQIVVMAQKPYAPPPPAPPKATPVEPLPQVAVAATPSAPPSHASSQPPPPPQETAAAKPAPPAATHKPAQTAKAEAPPRPAARAPHEPSQTNRRRPSEETIAPPIDAADLPPLDDAPPAQAQRPTQIATPGGSGAPPAAAALGPPVPLWRAQASNAPRPAATPAAEAEPANRECRPYTSSTTLTGRGLRVEGIACRGNDGQWRLVSEVPLR